MRAQILRPATRWLNLDGIDVKVIRPMQLDSLIPIMATLWDVTLKPQLLSVEVRSFLLELTNAHHEGGFEDCLANICERAQVIPPF